MINRLRPVFLCLLLFLPIAAFADIASVLGFLTPSQGEFSINLLSRFLGSLGGVLYGGGNQIIGSLMGIINSCAVILIGVAVCFTVWDGVVTSAASGEMMSNKGRKTVFTILRIVVGFCLVAPGPTGYSLAQSGVAWVVVQGVGLADRVSDKLYTYINDGGKVFTVQPSGLEDIKPYSRISSAILKSAICMYKLQDIQLAEQQATEEAHKAAMESEVSTGILLPELKTADEIGYSVNNNNTITFGSKNPDYNPGDPESTMYKSQCGQVAFTVSDATLGLRLGGTGTPEQIGQERKVVLGYVKQAASETVQNLLPVAKEISTLNKKDPDFDKTLNNVNARAVGAMVGAGMSFATMMDPARRRSAAYMQDEVKKLIEDIHQNGWMYTPLLVMTPVLTEAQVISVRAYNPDAKAPDLTISYFDDIDKKAREDLAYLVGLVDNEGYVSDANQLLYEVMRSNPTWSSIDFGAIDPYKDKEYLDTIVDYVDMIVGIPKSVLGWIKGTLNVGFDLITGLFGMLGNLTDILNPGKWLDLLVPGISLPSMPGIGGGDEVSDAGLGDWIKRGACYISPITCLIPGGGRRRRR